MMNNRHFRVAQRIVTQRLNAQRSFSTCRLVSQVLLFVMLPWTFFPVACQAAEPEFAIEQQADRLVITWGGQTVATYVFADKSLTRPYFAHVHALDGQQLTRNHPPLDGEDRMDHAALHPGIWLAFGDLSGADFWRNKDRIVHEVFTQAPAAVGQKATFSVRNRYERAACGVTAAALRTALAFLRPVQPTRFSRCLSSVRAALGTYLSAGSSNSLDPNPCNYE